MTDLLPVTQEDIDAARKWLCAASPSNIEALAALFAEHRLSHRPAQPDAEPGEGDKPVAWLYSYPGAASAVSIERVSYATTWTETPLYANARPTPAAPADVVERASRLRDAAEIPAAIELWFFRDLGETQRRQLFNWCGFPGVEANGEELQRGLLKEVLAAIGSGERGEVVNPS